MGRIRVRARALDMLGRQQIAGVPTAISELFKNAHDAYAHRVEVDFVRRKRLLVLRDDGVGMSYEDFNERWLTLGTESKLGEKAGIGPPPTDPSQEVRPILGEKGIGRLAIAAIGSQVLALTRARTAEGGGELVAAFIHWGVFTLPGVDIGVVQIPVRCLPGGSLPTRGDVQDMISEVRQNLLEVSDGNLPELIARINKDLDGFDVCPEELYNGLPDGPSLLGNGFGTHFVIQPTDETLPDDIDGGRDVQTASPMIKMLIGFTNTMTSEHNPLIEARFRDHGLDGIIRERIAGSSFFTPGEFKDADHHVAGEFDEFGHFEGSVQVYGGDAVPYLLPSHEAGGKPLGCGPFRINFAYVQGETRHTRLPPEEHGRIIEKLNRIGGLYIYRDGIRILPYGNSDYDFLNIEQRRTKSAGYYFFSYRRLFGVIDISREHNPNLVEKAGREGFRENNAYRQLKRLLENFFQELAADFFREDGFQASDFIEMREELREKHELLQRRATLVRERRKAFSKDLDAFFKSVNAEGPKLAVQALLERANDQFSTLARDAEADDASRILMDLETQIYESLRAVDEQHRVARPRGIGLTRQLQREWEAYRRVRHLLEQDVFRPGFARVAELVDRHASRIHANLDQRRRLNRVLKDTSDSHLKKAGSLRRAANREVEQVKKRVLDRTREGLVALEEAIRSTVSEFESTDTEDLKPREFDQMRAALEARIVEAADTQTNQLEKLQQQLKVVGTAQGLDEMELTDIFEDELEALRERENAALQLAQVGMALGIVHHEFSSTINGVRNGIRQLSRWAASNEPLRKLYRDIRTSFDHLDGYLTLFTPLDRRLQRKRAKISGSDIHSFLAELFSERLKRHNVELEMSQAFREATLTEYPSSVYPCFVNLLDNAIFWLASRREKGSQRTVRLDADGDALIIADNGPGIPMRDMEAVFEMGFTRRPGGRGMGLYISRRALGEIGYHLTLDPPQENSSGTSFRIAPKPADT